MQVNFQTQRTTPSFQKLHITRCGNDFLTDWVKSSGKNTELKGLSKVIKSFPKTYIDITKYDNDSLIANIVNKQIKRTAILIQSNEDPLHFMQRIIRKATKFKNKKI